MSSGEQHTPEASATFSQSTELLGAIKPISEQQPQENPTPTSEEEVVERTKTLAERHPDWPPITVQIFLSGHDTPGDLADLAELIPRSDIYLYESGTGDKFTRAFQALANEDLSPSRIEEVLEQSKGIRGTAWEAIVRGVQGSKAIVGHIDLRPGDEVDGMEISDKYNATFSAPVDYNDFNGDLQSLEVGAAELAALQSKREHEMPLRFETELEKIFSDHPELKQKENLNILQSMGSYHTGLKRAFTDAGVKAEHILHHSPYIYSYRYQMQREFAFGRQPDKDVVAKVLLENVLEDALEHSAVQGDPLGHEESVPYIRKIASAFTTEEIESFYNQVGSKLSERPQAEPDGEDERKAWAKSAVVALLNDQLSAKDMPPLPQSTDEIRQSITAS